jgi:hypothetical protein
MKWLTLENADATATGKQHAYIHKVCMTPYIREKYDGNISLCGRSCCINEDELRVSYNDLESEPLNESKACKLCLKIMKET